MTLIQQLTRDEGLRLMPYRDTMGKLTIGIGRNLTDVGITEAEALVLLANDIQTATTNLATRMPWTSALDEVRRNALINMAFNMGIDGLAQFHHFLAALQAGDWTEASADMLDSLWARQVGDRAKRLATQIEVGEMQ